MSDTLIQAAAAATAVAAALNATPAQPLTVDSAAAILGAALQAAGPLISPQVGAAVSLASLALGAIHIAMQSGTGLTAEQLTALFAADDAAIAADKAAHPAA